MHISKFPYNITKLHSILFVAESDENAFQSRTKQFFWTRVGSIGFIKALASLELQTEANHTHSSPEKWLCSRLKSILITFRYKQYRNNCCEAVNESPYNRLTRYSMKRSLWKSSVTTALCTVELRAGTCSQCATFLLNKQVLSCTKGKPGTGHYLLTG